MFFAILTVLHIIMCVALILIVLLQTGKGSDLAGAFGGGTSNTAFGVTSAISLIGKLTTAAAFCFLFTSFTLSLLPRGTGGASVIEEQAAPTAQEDPAEDAAKGIEESNAKVPADASSSEADLEESESDVDYSDEGVTDSDYTTGSDKAEDNSESDVY